MKGLRFDRVEVALIGFLAAFCLTIATMAVKAVLQ